MITSKHKSSDGRRGSGSPLGPRIEHEIDGPGPLGGPTVAAHFACATCGERITQGDANALFEPDGAGRRSGAWVVVHRGECDAPWNSRDRFWYWQELWRLLVQLLHNSGYDLEVVCSEVRRMAENERRSKETRRHPEEEVG